jgi:pimeloyl-ACP methyl ester carboxylesterase
VYTETGPCDGAAVFYCHGAIGTPLGRAIDLEAITDELGIRHFAISRPGTGGSDPAPGRTVASFGTDLRELAEAVGLERVAVVGVSAGGPYALAAARASPERVSRVAVCSSVSPLCPLHRTPGMKLRIRIALAALARAPATCAALGDAALPLVGRHPALVSRVIAAHSAPGERARVRRGRARSAAAASFLDAAANGVRGMIDDYLVYAADWGFAPSEVAPEVHLWHGLEDPLVPIEHALELAVTIPRCRVFLDPEEGHHFFRRRLREILAALIGRDGADADAAPAATAGRLAEVRLASRARSGTR